MGLYNTVFGEHDFGRALIGILEEVQKFDVGRYRDAWVEMQEEQLFIRVHTRNGGGNREGYADENESMQAHPWYDRDNDDDYDITYADFYFKVPPAGEGIEAKLHEGLTSIAQEPVDMKAKWEAVIANLGKS